MTFVNPLRARIPETPASVNPETFAVMLESDGNFETYTELNAAAVLHEPDPETMWSSDLEWVHKSILQEAREKDVKKLQQIETYEEVPQVEAEGPKIISSRFVDKWEENGELRSRLVSRGYESGHADPASLCAATPSIVATRIAFVLGLAQDVEMAVADISGAFLHAVLEKHLFVTPPAEHREPGVVWKNNTDLRFSMNSTRLSFNVFSSCTKKLSRCFRFPTLRRSSTCTTTMIVSLCETPFVTKQPGSDSKRSKPNSSIVFSK